MRFNEDTKIMVEQLTLLPYLEHHVSFYHEWMQDPDLQAATASEPLTLEQEYEMQSSWRTDVQKLTFIICQADEDATIHTRDVEGELHAMMGDINMFISVVDDDDDSTQGMVVGEIDIMIAIMTLQNRGLGRAAVLTFLKNILTYEKEILKEAFPTRPYPKAHDGPPIPELFDYFTVKIGSHNHRSMALFQILGFTIVQDEPNIFEEYEFRLHRPTMAHINCLMERFGVGDYREMSYTNPRYSTPEPIESEEDLAERFGGLYLSTEQDDDEAPRGRTRERE